MNENDSQKPDRDELLIRLDAASRAGSVQATKLLLEEIRRDADTAETEQSALDALDFTPTKLLPKAVHD